MITRKGHKTVPRLHQAGDRFLEGSAVVVAPARVVTGMPLLMMGRATVTMLATGPLLLLVAVPLAVAVFLSGVRTMGAAVLLSHHQSVIPPVAPALEFSLFRPPVEEHVLLFRPVAAVVLLGAFLLVLLLVFFQGLRVVAVLAAGALQALQA